MIRILLRVLFGIGVIGAAGAAGPAMPFVVAAATPVAIIAYRRHLPPAKNRRPRAAPRTAATPARRPPTALRRIR
jgi:hypothetical protein